VSRLVDTELNAHFDAMTATGNALALVERRIDELLEVARELGTTRDLPEEPSGS
jgi:hypothetical protein